MIRLVCESYTNFPLESLLIPGGNPGALQKQSKSFAFSKFGKEETCGTSLSQFSSR